MSNIVVTVGSPPRGSGQQAAKVVQAQSMRATLAWGGSPSTATVIYPGCAVGAGISAGAFVMTPSGRCSFTVYAGQPLHERAPGVSGRCGTRRDSVSETVQRAPGSETAGWTGEKKWALKNLNAARRQLVNIQVVTKESGEWDLTRNGSLRFSSIGKKDLAYSCLYAYVRALVWLKTGELEFSNAADDGEAGCYSA